MSSDTMAFNKMAQVVVHSGILLVSSNVLSATWASK